MCSIYSQRIHGIPDERSRLLKELRKKEVSEASRQHLAMNIQRSSD